MTRTFAALIALGMGVFGVVHGAAAWSQFHSPWRSPVTYYFQSPSNDLGATTSEEIVHRAVADWMNVSCTGLRARFEGHTTRVPGDNDGFNVFGWVHENWTAGSGVIGQTNFRSSSQGSESDIKFNGVHFSWTTGEGTSRNVNAYSIVAHEIGHFFGLGHSNQRDAVMYASYSGGVLAVSDDDEAGICALYPGPKPGCDQTNCPPGFMCVDGYCTPDGTPPPPPPPPPPVSIPCTPCQTSADCGGPADSCLRYAEDGNKTFCGRSCAGDGDCEDSQRCLSVANAGRQCVRVVNGVETCEGAAVPTDPSDPSGGESPGGDYSEVPDAMVGQPCELNADCGAGVCLEQGGTTFCTRGCESSARCPTGYVCQELGGDAFCLAPAGGSTDSLATEIRGGCSVGGTNAPTTQGVGLMWLVFAFWTRRRLRPARAPR